MYRWILGLGLMCVLVACDAGTVENRLPSAITPAPSQTPDGMSGDVSNFIQPIASQPLGASPLPGCDPLALSVWETKFYLPDDVLDDPQAIRDLGKAFSNLDYPECVGWARSHALQAYQSAALIAEARIGNNILNESTYNNDFSAAMDNYEAAMTNLPLASPPMPTVVPTDAVPCPGMNMTCPELSCAQAYACLIEGNTSLDANHDSVPCENICR